MASAAAPLLAAAAVADALPAEAAAAAALCPVCLTEATDAAVASCAHRFCHGCITRWAAAHAAPRCPLCGAPAGRLRLDAGGGEEVEVDVGAAQSPAAAGPEEEGELDLDASILRAEAAALRSRLGGAHNGAALRARAGGYALFAQIGAALALLERRLAPDAPSLGAGGARGVLLELHALDELTSCASTGRPPQPGAAAERWAAMQAAAAAGDGDYGGGGGGYSDDDEDDGGDDYDGDDGDYDFGGGHRTPGRRAAPRSRARRR